jgi:hypothetical protein
LPEYVSVNQLVDTVTEAAGKRVNTRYVQGPVGVQSRNFSNEKIYSTGWRPRFSLRDGIQRTYPWIEEQVLAARRGSARRANAVSEAAAVDPAPDARARGNVGQPGVGQPSKR